MRTARPRVENEGGCRVCLDSASCATPNHGTSGRPQKSVCRTKLGRAAFSSTPTWLLRASSVILGPIQSGASRGLTSHHAVKLQCAKSSVGQCRSRDRGVPPMSLPSREEPCRIRFESVRPFFFAPPLPPHSDVHVSVQRHVSRTLHAHLNGEHGDASRRPLANSRSTRQQE